MLWLDVFKTFNRFRVRYLVAGGVAGTLYGNPRFTKDLDVLVDLRPENLKRLTRSFTTMGFMPRAPVTPDDLLSAAKRERWIRDKGMKAFTFVKPKDALQNVDILIAVRVDFKRAYGKREVFRLGAVRIPVVCKRDLIRMKKKAGREQDLYDVAILKAIRTFRKRSP